MPEARRGPAEAPAGLRLGEHLVERIIGRGAMAAVYLCRDPRGRAVAVKWLDRCLPGQGPEDEALSPLALRRFQREAEAMQRVDHPGLVRFHGQGVAQGRPFLVMEYVEGGDLRAYGEKLAARPPLERYARARTIGQALCEALGALHLAGLVHRDVKPSNVLVDPDGRVVLGDLGVVAELDEARLHRGGGFIGTPGYASPEQLRGDPVDVRTDLYGVGATLYTLLAQRRPFDSSARPGDGLPPAPSRWDPELPADLEALVLRLMAPRPEDRFRDADEAARALAQVSAGGGSMPLAGRGDLVAELTAHLDAVEAQGGSLVVELVGRPGLGRRWLCGVARAAGKARGLQVIEPGEGAALAGALRRAAVEPGQVVLSLGRLPVELPAGLRRVRMVLRPLGVAELRRTVVAVAPLTPDPAGAALELHRLSGGIPALLLPLLQRLVVGARLAIPPEPPALPEADAMLAGIELDGLEALGALALLGRPASAEELSLVAALPAEPWLLQAEERGLVGVLDGRWHFQAQAIAQACLRALPDPDALRSRLGRVADPAGPEAGEAEPVALERLWAGRPVEALELARARLARAGAQGDRRAEGFAYLELGEVELALHRHASARRVLANGSALARALEDDELRVRCHVARAMAELGQPGSAAIRRAAAASALDRVAPLAIGADSRRRPTDALVFMAWARASAELGDARASEQAEQRALRRLDLLEAADRIRLLLGLAGASLRREDAASLASITQRLEADAESRPWVAWRLRARRARLRGLPEPLPELLAVGLSPEDRARLQGPGAGAPAALSEPDPPPATALPR